MNNEGLYLLRTILDHPGEDTPRLVYADWLEENGEPARAEFIRDQIGIFNTTCELWDGVHCDIFNEQLGEYRVQTWCKACQKKKRSVYPEDMGGVPVCVQNQDRHREPLIRELTGLPSFDNTMGTGHPTLGKQCTPTYRRGFVDEVACKMGCWLEFGKEIIRWHPVSKVWITDKSPWESLEDEKTFGWWPKSDWDHNRRFEYCDINEEILSLIAKHPGRVRTPVDWDFSKSSGIVAFSSKTDSIEALSEACIQWAKENEQ